MEGIGNNAYVNVTSNSNITKNLDVALEFPSDIANIDGIWVWGNQTAWTPIMGNLSLTVTCPLKSHGIKDELSIWCYNSTDRINYSFYCPIPRVITTKTKSLTCVYNQTVQVGESGVLDRKSVV